LFSAMECDVPWREEDPQDILDAPLCIDDEFAGWLEEVGGFHLVTDLHGDVVLLVFNKLYWV
jgi:hypothetical protein